MQGEVTTNYLSGRSPSTIATMTQRPQLDLTALAVCADRDVDVNSLCAQNPFAELTNATWSTAACRTHGEFRQ
jgi:hypothetical protein